MRSGHHPLRAAAVLPRAALAALGERGVTAGAVLVLTDGPCQSPRVRLATELSVTAGAPGEAAQLLDDCSFDAVVFALGEIDAAQLQSLLDAVAARTAPDTVLVLHLAAAGPQGAAGTPGMPNPQGRRQADARETLHLLLLRCGYDRVWPHAHGQALCVSAKRAPPAVRSRTCSIIVPVYNESPTFPELMRRLLAKRLDTLGLEREIIVVESNSTDGTRAQVAGFATTPGVRILWQERPRGKGHAVRAGLAVATGDIVLIQDADLEYEIDDYDALLQPLLEERAAFVLGCRQGGRMRMRRFAHQRLLGEALNVAHVLLRTLINVLYGQNMQDPFTMFKVFRRDCLYGLRFECDRFDFDHELVIKLVLKGYRPLEIPVRYRARSFRQGKKISFLLDPPALLAADFKYRLRRLRPRLD